MPSYFGEHAGYAVVRLAVATFVTTLVLSVASPLPAEAQPVAKMYRIGVMAHTCIRQPEDRPPAITSGLPRASPEFAASAGDPSLGFRRIRFSAARYSLRMVFHFGSLFVR